MGGALVNDESRFTVHTAAEVISAWQDGEEGEMSNSVLYAAIAVGLLLVIGGSLLQIDWNRPWDSKAIMGWVGIVATVMFFLISDHTAALRAQPLLHFSDENESNARPASANRWRAMIVFLPSPPRSSASKFWRRFAQLLQPARTGR